MKFTTSLLIVLLLVGLSIEQTHRLRRTATSATRSSSVRKVHASPAVRRAIIEAASRQEDAATSVLPDATCAGDRSDIILIDPEVRPIIQKFTNRVGMDFLNTENKATQVFGSPFFLSIGFMHYLELLDDKAKQEFYDTLNIGDRDQDLEAAFNTWDQNIHPVGSKQILGSVNVLASSGFSGSLDKLSSTFGTCPYSMDFTQRSTIRKALQELMVKVAGGDTNKFKIDLRYDNVIILVVSKFNFAWATPFDAKKTANATFNDAKKNKITTAFISTDDNLMYSKSGDHQIVQIPLEGKKHSLTLLLPSEGSTFDFTKLKGGDPLKSLLADVKSTAVRVVIPKFSLDKVDSYSQIPGEKPDLDHSGLDLRLLSYSTVAIDEKGIRSLGKPSSLRDATASASTAATVTPTVTVTFDRPFFFFIHDNSNRQMLQVGYVNQPSSTASDKTDDDGPL